jgi:TolB-like protein
MASLIPGFGYDIFISYRQKDNKYDGWVTEFVDNLKRELEATFKDDVSIYFDINPHDGLLETHDVDASLKEKLKCLVFIPIISQTYCDPRSFAWEHEFRAFIDMASKDQFGMKLKFPGGNVSSRILPVKIHDLDADDKILLETELGGVLRSIEFIYKSPGVNRPLRSNEEHPDENINHVIYRDQINKVANAIKEILYAMALPHKAGSEKIIHPTITLPAGKPVASRSRSRFRTVAGIIAIVLLILIFSTKTLISKNKFTNSIIVLPFSTQDSSQAYFAEGIAVDVITELAKVKNISTLSWNTSASYTGSGRKPLKEIASETGVVYVLTGIIQRDKENIRVNVELVNPRTGKNIWAQSWDKELKFVFDIQKQIAREVAKELGVKLSSEENAKLNSYSTRNIEAYDLFLKARAESRKMFWGPAFLRKSTQILNEALELDPDFPQALTLRANNRIDLAVYDRLDPLVEATKIKEDLNKSLLLDPDYSDTYIVLGIENWFLEWNFKEAKKNLEKGWELSNYGEAPITQCFCGIIEYNMATGNYLKALTLLGKVEKIDPDYPYDAVEKLLTYAVTRDTVSIRKILSSYSGPGSIKASIYYELGNYKEAINELLAEYTEESMNSYGIPLSALLASAYYKAGMVEKSDSLLNQLINLAEKERNIDFSLAFNFAARGDKENSLKWYKSAYLKHDLGITSTLYTTDLKLIINEPEIQKILKEIGIVDDSDGG